VKSSGQGCPDRLSGDMIPLPARIVALADVYDALRSRRTYKPALSNRTAVTAMLERWIGQFDPFLLQLFKRCEKDFDRINRRTATDLKHSISR
jgi:putative two-component system response regulator